MPELGFIFDWDGVIVDSSVLHEKSWEALAQEISRPLPHNHFKQGFGKRNEIIIPEILKWSKDPQQIKNWGERKEALYREFAKETGIHLLPGVKDFLQDMQRHQIPAVIGTSTSRENISLAFEQLGIKGFFIGAICSEDVTRGKPDPEVFLKGAMLLQLPPGQCVVFEDSTHGIEAARAGEMKAVAIKTSQTEADLYQAGAHMLVDTPKELTIRSIQQLM
jgi:HAD superfamily hydrolase (TIGR01509 family)